MKNTSLKRLACLAITLLLWATLAVPALAGGADEVAQVQIHIYDEDESPDVAAFYQTLAENGTFAITLRNEQGETFEFKSLDGYSVKAYSSLMPESYYDPSRVTYTIKRMGDATGYETFSTFIQAGGSYTIVSVPLPQGYTLVSDSLIGGNMVRIAKTQQPTGQANPTKYTFTRGGESMSFSDAYESYIFDGDRYIFSAPHGTTFQFSKDVTLEIFGGAQKETITLKAGETVTPEPSKDYTLTLGGAFVIFGIQPSRQLYDISIDSYRGVGADILPIADLLAGATPTEPTQPEPAPAALTATPTASAVTVNGESVAFDAYNIEGNNYFKLRDLAFVLSGSAKQFAVDWDAANQAILLTSGGVYAPNGSEMAGKGAGSKTPVATTAKIVLDGHEVALTAYNIEGNNYFKLRDIGQAFDFSVAWDDVTRTIAIDTAQGYTP